MTLTPARLLEHARAAREETIPPRSTSRVQDSGPIALLIRHEG